MKTKLVGFSFAAISPANQAALSALVPGLNIGLDVWPLILSWLANADNYKDDAPPSVLDTRLLLQVYVLKLAGCYLEPWVTPCEGVRYGVRLVGSDLDVKVTISSVSWKPGMRTIEIEYLEGVSDAQSEAARRILGLEGDDLKRQRSCGGGETFQCKSSTLSDSVCGVTVVTTS